MPSPSGATPWVPPTPQKLLRAPFARNSAKAFNTIARTVRMRRRQPHRKSAISFLAQNSPKEQNPAPELPVPGFRCPTSLLARSLRAGPSTSGRMSPDPDKNGFRARTREAAGRLWLGVGRRGLLSRVLGEIAISARPLARRYFI